MHYLIDGHNLIAQMPDISLEDPDDEAKLVLRLRSWVAAGRNREVTVIFDGGLPGGMWHRLSTRRIKAIFAAEDSSADAMLRKRVKSVKDAKAYTLVSSDRAILAAAKDRRMPYMTSELFAKSLAEHLSSLEQPESTPDSDTEEKPQVSDAEIAEWLQLFESDVVEETTGAEQESPRESGRTSSARSRPRATSQKKPASDRLEDPASMKSGEHGLDDEEVSKWMEIFSKSGDKN